MRPLNGEKMGIPITIDQTGADETPERRKPGAPKGSRKTRTASFDRAQNIKQSSIAQTGKLLSLSPTTPTDLAEQWQIGNEDAHGVSIKVLRQPKGEPMASAELVTDMPLLDYSLARIAGKYGPGVYFVRGTGQWAHRACKISVAPEYARESGFGVIAEPPRPTAGDVLAMQTINKLGEGAPVQGVELLAAIERMIEAKIKPAAPVVAVAPNIDSQFDQMFKWMGLMDRLEERAMKVAERRLGVEPKDTEAAPETTGQMIMSLLPQALTLFGDMMKNRNPEPRQVQRVAVPLRRPMPPQAQPTMKQVEAPQAPAQPQEERPSMTLDTDEQHTLSLAKRLLGSFGADLAQLAERPETDEELGDEIGSLIPPMFHRELVKLSDLVKAKGSGIMAEIHPALTSPRWPGILAEMARKINAAG